MSFFIAKVCLEMDASPRAVWASQAALEAAMPAALGSEGPVVLVSVERRRIYPRVRFPALDLIIH